MPPSQTIDTSHLIDQCSIARATGIMGDGWTLLIVRELFWGKTRYEQLAQGTGMASNVLAARLKKMVQEGLVCKTVVPGDARRFDYTLTPKGKDLFPVLMSLMAWGDRWSAGEAGPLVQLRHSLCGKRTQPGLQCSACGQALQPAHIRTSIARAYKLL